MNEINSGKGLRDTQNSSECSDPLQGDASPSSYQRLVASPTAVSQYVVQLPDGSQHLTFENQQFKSRAFFPSPNNQTRPAFVTPPHNRQTASLRPAFRSLSIDSNLDNFSSSEYHQTTISPFTSPKRIRPTPKRGPPPLAAPEKRLNFITNTKTLSPEVRGSFV